MNNHIYSAWIGVKYWLGKNDLPYYLLQATAFFCFTILLAYQLLGAIPFPRSDEWIYIDYALGIRPISWGWLWQQHVDHRIPLQKILQVLFLRLSSADFRILVFANTAFAYLTVLFIIKAVRSYRGETRVGDLIFPLVILNPGFPPFNWGFHFQFMSSVLLTLFSVSFLILSSQHNRHLNIAFSSACLFLLAFCGMNGAISAGIIASLMFVFFLAVTPVQAKKGFWLVSFLLLVPILAVLTVLIDWRPSGASGLPKDFALFSLVKSVFENWTMLINPQLWQFPPLPAVLYYGINITMYLTAIVIISRRIRIFRNSPSECLHGRLALLSVMLATLLLLLSISVSRSGYWSSGLEKHYGYLAVILPLVSWIIISTETSIRLTSITSVLYLTLYGSIYLVNASHVLGNQINHDRNEIHHTIIDIGSGSPVDAFVSKHIKRFYYVDTEQTREIVIKGIRQLKTAGISPYIYLNN